MLMIGNTHKGWQLTCMASLLATSDTTLELEEYACAATEHIDLHENYTKTIAATSNPKEDTEG